MYSLTLPFGSRKKIWEVEGGYHCSIVGTCLSLYDLRKLAAHCKLVMPSSASEYLVHGYFVHEAGRQGPVAKQMQKILDRKYRQALLRFSRVSEPQEIEKLWQEALDEGDIPGPYWAVMTHLQAHSELCDRVFGDVHMLSHLTGAANRADIRALRQLEKANAELREDLDKCRFELRKRAEYGDSLRSGIDAKNSELESVRGELKRANGIISSRPDLAECEARCSLLETKLDRASTRCESLRVRLEEERQTNRALAQDRDRLQKQVSGLEAEQTALEQDLITLLSDRHVCTNPEKRCDKHGLCGRAILYVGGRSNLVQHYRRLVEEMGGIFLYHDGGQEDSPHRLTELLLQADDVCCPLDCISHQATAIIKRDCPQDRTVQHLLRSSGLSSFARALVDLAASGGS
jgi:hypothetical protein